MLFAIALGGATGTLARYGVGAFAQRWSAEFPYSTLIINVTGSFLLGFLMKWLLQSGESPELRAGLTIGFCGGFTTFSTFSYETVRLIQEGETGKAAAYVLLSVLVSLAATFAGFALAPGALRG